jgi:hypothetical protein
MRRIAFSILLGCGIQASLEAQTNSQPAPGDTNAPTANVAPTVVSRSANSRVWARISSQTNADGQVSLVTNKAYTEMATGLCVQGPDGSWSDAAPVIAPDNVLGGASVGGTRHQVHFAKNANTAGGAIHLVAPDGKVFDSRVYGLSYWDTASDKSVLLASIQDCQGVIGGKDLVVYADAFNGVKADLVYVFTKAGLEQDVVLKEQTPTPDSLGLDPRTTRLQILTEFFDPPTPVIRSRIFNGVEDDARLNFGGMIIGVGRAFLAQGQVKSNGTVVGSVLKQWRQIEGRNFLVEEIPYSTVIKSLQTLPLHASTTPVGSAIKHLAALEPLLPREASSKGPSMPMRTVRATPTQVGLVVDYIVWNNDSPNGNVFQSDTTYDISGTVFTYGPNYFEGGAVIKFSFSGGSWIVNYGDAPFYFAGSAYRPTVFTSSDDNSVGDTIAGSSGNPTPGYYWYLFENAPVGNGLTEVVAHARFAYEGYGNIGWYESTTNLNLVVQDCQFVQCGADAIWLNLSGSYNIQLLNDLFTGCCGAALVGDNNITLDAENITADNINDIVDVYMTPSWGGGITNSILSNFGDPYGSVWQFTLDHTDYEYQNSGLYQTVGDGRHYLSYGSQDRHNGTTNINPALLAELGTKTTWPPTNVYANQTMSTATTLGPAVPRENMTQPDLGYGYDPLDYVFGGTTVNANLTFTPGTAVGWFKGSGTDYGIRMGNSQVASFSGTATSPVWWVRGNTVQEQGGSVAWPGAGATGGLVGQANLFFTHCSILGFGDGGSLNHFRDDSGYLIVNAQNSEFYGGSLRGDLLSCCFTNSLMDRMSLGQVQGWPGNVFLLTNCTFHGGELSLIPNHTAITLAVRDSAFDGTSITASGYGSNPSYASYDYNAFTDGANRFPIGGTHDQPVTGGFNWQSSWFGKYYLPSGSPLITAGDQSAANIGLYHFTTQTSQVPEGDAVVDIGYHYVATHANGNPLDSNGNGIQDYLEDSNGNGIYDPGVDLGDWLPYLPDSNNLIGLQIYTPMQ